MNRMRARYVLSLTILLSFTRPGQPNRHTRPDLGPARTLFIRLPQSPAPATDEQFARWREQASAALFLPRTMPPVAVHTFGGFLHPMPGVVAHRVTYGTQVGMRGHVHRPSS